MKHLAVQSLFYTILAISFTLSYGQIRIVSTSHSFQGTNIASPVLSSRTATWTLDWKNTDRKLTADTAFIGISGIDVSSSIVDFSIGFDTTSDTEITMQIKVGSKCAINLIQHFVLSSFDYRVNLIQNVDFDADADFSIILGSGSTDAELNYTISYTPPRGLYSEYSTGTTAYVSFTAVKLDYTSTNYHFDYEVMQVTSSQVVIKIRKFGDTRLLALKGQVLIVSKTAKDEIGFSSTRIIEGFSPASGQTAMMLTEEVSTRTDYTGRPESIFFLSGYIFDNNYVAIATAGELGVSASDTITITMLSNQINSAQIRAVQYDVLLFCENEDDCITSQDPVVITGTTQLTSFLGTELSDASLSYDRTLSFDVAFKRFFSSVPQYPCLGLQGGNADASFSISITGVTKKSVTITVQAFANQAITGITITYVASNWNGFQCSLVDLTPYLPSPSAPASDWMIIPFSASYTPTPEFTGNVICRVALVEINMPLSQSISFGSSEVSGTTTDTSISCALNMDQDSFTSLKGYVFLYPDPNNVNSMYGLATMDIPAATLTDNNYYSVSGSLTNGQIDYSQSPYIFTFISTLANCGTLALETTQTINYYARDSSGPTCDFKWTFSIRDTYCSTNPKYVYTSVSFLRNNSHTVVYPTDSTAFEIVQGQDYVCMVADFTSPNEYALVIADESSYNGTIRFIQNIGKVARIVQTSILVPSGSGIVRQATFSPITISSSSKLTYHLIRVQSAGTWALGGTFDYFTSFAFSFSELEFSVGNFGYNGADLTKAKDAYGTVYATRVYMHDKGLDFECQAQITFSGLIRGMYLDGQLVLAGSSPDPDTSVTITSEINAKFEGNTANAGFVTVIGTNLVITSLDFVNCVDGSNTPLTPTPIWTDYAPYDLLATSNTFYFPATDQAYPSGCSTFKDASTCYVCESDKQLFQGTCVSMCTDTTSFVPVRDLYCATNSENFGVKRTSTIYADSAKTITIDYKINPYVSLDAAVTIFYPFAVSKTNYPGVISTMPNTPSLAASTLYLKRISSRRMRMLQTSNPVFESFDMTGTFSISSVATAGYLQVQIVTLGLVQDIYLFIIKDPVRQEIALSKTYMPISSPVNTVTTTDIFEIQVVIDCASCNLVIDYVGQVAITLNQRTAIYSNTFTTRASYQLHRTLSGTSYLTIDCTQSTYFSFSIVGSYLAYGPNSLLFRDNVNLLAVASPCSIANCHNCFEDTCLSCADSYFLTQDGTECVTSCPNWPGERLCKDIEKDSRLIEAARVIDRIRKISNEFLSEISALGLKGLHSIRSQCLQSTLGYFIFLNVDYPTNYLEFAYDNYGGLNLPNPWGNAHVHKPMRRRSGARMLESDVPMEIDEVSSLNEYSEDHRIVANIGYILVVLFASILLVISVEALYEGVRKTEGYDSKWYFKTVKKSSLSLRWSYLLNELISRYQDLAFFSMLGIYDAGKDEIETDNGNTALAVIGFLIIVGELALLFFLVRRVFNHVQVTTKKEDKESAKDEPKMDEYLKRRTILHEELAKDHLMQMLYPFFLVLRIFGFSFTVVFIPGVTAIQLVFLDLSSILMVVYLIKFKPFEEKAQLHMTLAYEIDFLVAAFAVTFIQITSHAENSDIAASFGVLLILATVSMTFLNILSFYLDIKEKVPEMIQQLKALKKASSKRKVAPSPPRLSVESPSQLMQLAKNSSEKTPNSGSPHERVFLVTAQDFDPNNSFSDIATDKVPSGKGVESSWRVRPTSKGVTQERLSIIDGTGLIGLRSRNFQRPSMISPTNLEIKNPLIDIESIDQISSPKIAPSEADSRIKMV